MPSDKVVVPNENFDSVGLAEEAWKDAVRGPLLEPEGIGERQRHLDK